MTKNASKYPQIRALGLSRCWRARTPCPTLTICLLVVVELSYLQRERPQVASCATDVPTTLPRNWPAKVSNLPCNCQYCVVDCINTACQYTPWRKARKITVVEGLKEGEVAVREPFEGLNVRELKDLLRENNLAQSGRKIELIERLVGAGVQDTRIQ